MTKKTDDGQSTAAAAAAKADTKTGRKTGSKAAAAKADTAIPGAVAGCIEPEAHSHTLRLAQLDMPDGDTLQRLAEQFRLFGDATRVKILLALSKGPMCVCDLGELLCCGQSLISHQLRLLRQAHLVRFEKKGKSSVYMLDDEHVWQIISLGLSHVREDDNGGERK